MKNILKKHGVDACIISHVDSLTYLTGFKGLVPTEREAYGLITAAGVFLVVPRMYEVGAEKSALSGVVVVPAAERNTMLQSLKVCLGSSRRVGCEAESLSVAEFQAMEEAFGCEMVPLKQVLSGLRLVKSEIEVEKIRAAQQLTYAALDKLVPSLTAGVSEYEIQMKLNALMVELGAEGPSFEAIVAFGKGSAEPHYKTSGKTLVKGDMILIDCGALVDGYCGDTTRMFFTAEPTAEQQKTYELVLAAQQSAIAGIRAGLTGEQAWALSADIFEKAGESEHFLHGLGHGIGVAVHEGPSLRRGVADVLEPGMVFSVEPGLYYPAWGGIRIEDLVVCRKDGVDVLGEYSTEIRVI